MPALTEYDPIAPNSPTYQSHFRSESIQSESDPMVNNFSQGQGQGSSRQQGRPVGRNEEVGGVQRGMVGAGYGPYAYTLPAGQPGPGRFPSKESSSSFDSSAYLPTKGRHNLSSTDQNQATPKQDSATTAFLLWDNKDDMDDNLHMAGGKGDSDWDPFSLRGWMNGLTIFILLAGLIVLFAGWPIIVAFQNDAKSSGGNTPGFNLGGINGSGQVPAITNFPSLIDQDTPAGVRSRTGFDGKSYDLVFSDEFNTDGRSFYAGDDPFWEAVDLHYWATGDFEWYDPGQVSTKDGSLVIEMTQAPTHGLDFRSGMLQSWNKFCFSENAYIEVSVKLPGNNKIGGFWPGVWTMGNLGRPGYGATTDGTWPYSYAACDVGTLANQTYANGTGPTAALKTGSNDGSLSFLPGQRWSACTCAGEDHPGPSTNIGRGVPEIDIIEAQINVADSIGQVSQSLQTAPFDASYQFNVNDTEIYNTGTTQINTYLGGVYQQAVSALSNTNSANYAGTTGGFGTYGYEMTADPNDRDNGYITWVNTGQPSWTVRAGATGPNPLVGLSQRPIPEEPMAMIINFGMSNNFQTVDFEGLTFPNYMYVDYVRVYQRTDMINIGCDPTGYPTKDFIDRHPTAYNNNNITTWDTYLKTDEGSKFTWPKNSLIDTC